MAIYDPQNQIVIDKPIAPAQAIPMDARSYFYDGGLLKYRPYQSVAEVNATILLAKFRKGHFPVYINDGGVLQLNGEFVGGTIKEYWYRNGVTDGSLVEKGTAGPEPDINRLKRYPFKTAGGETELQNNEWMGATFMSGTRSNGEIFTTGDDGFEMDPDSWIFDDVTGTMTPPAALGAENIRLTFKNINI